MPVAAVVKKGTMFGYWKMIKEVDKVNGKRKFLCICTGCEDNNKKEVFYGDLKRGKSNSCGCTKKEAARLRQTHGLSKHPLYTVYNNMKARCYDPKNDRYSRYGARGITICKEWLNDFKVFADWSFANGYDKNLQIDLENNDGDYEPDNCRWVTRKLNANNKSKSTKITYENTVYSSFRLFWEKHNKNVSFVTAERRWKAGIEPYEAITKPVSRTKNLHPLTYNNKYYSSFKLFWEQHNKNVTYTTAYKRYTKIGMSAIDAVTKKDTRGEANVKRTIHGKSNHPLFYVYRNMVSGNNEIPLIWSTVEDFIDWSEKNGYEEGKKFHKKDAFKPYSSRNCCFGISKYKEELIKYKSRTYTSFLQFWEKYNTGVKYNTARYRYIELNFSPIDAVTQPEIIQDHVKTIKYKGITYNSFKDFWKDYNTNVSYVTAIRRYREQGMTPIEAVTSKRMRFYFAPELVQQRKNAKDLTQQEGR